MSYGSYTKWDISRKGIYCATLSYFVREAKAPKKTVTVKLSMYPTLTLTSILGKQEKSNRYTVDNYFSL